MINNLKIKIFADTGDKKSLLDLAGKNWIDGVTTNPLLLQKAGVNNYKEFALEVLQEIKKPISFEVFSDDLSEMYDQAKEIASWGENVWVKIPVTNTQGESCADIIHQLSKAGVQVNATAVFTLLQVIELSQSLQGGAPSIISLFSGRIADAGTDPFPIAQSAVSICKSYDQNINLLWASPRQLFDVVLAEKAGCDIITVSPDILNKINLLGKDLVEFSRETVKMFYDAGKAAGFKL